jgi:hypothetical protein
MGYPSTLVGTDVASEIGRMKLRMYLGAALYKRENVSDQQAAAIYAHSAGL